MAETPRDAALANRLAAANLDWIVPDWDVPATVRAFVTTRHGGASAGPYASMNAGGAAVNYASPARDGSDDPAAIAANRARLASFTAAPPVFLEQVHGTTVAAIDAANAGRLRATPPRADAAVTNDAGVVLAVRAADCLPVLFADRAASVVAAAHAGWRGLAAGVLEATLAAMRVAPSTVVAWLGPAIGPAAFEVGADVHAAFTAHDPQAAAAFVALREGKWHADLCALARLRLAHAGVGAVTGGGWCTFNDAKRFYSYRREKVTGRMAAVIWRANLETRD